MRRWCPSVRAEPAGGLWSNRAVTGCAGQHDNDASRSTGPEVLIEPFNPMEGLKVVFVLHHDAPVELMQEA